MNTTTPRTTTSNNDFNSSSPTSSSPSVIQRIKHRLTSLYTNLTISEISGSLGDLGTLLPLLVALSTQRSIKLAPALFFGGISNIITGLTWDVPMCVQPMKSIAAVALSENWSPGSVTASGIITGAFVFLLGITSFINVVNTIVPGNVVSGLQIGVGVRLASKGIGMVSGLGWVDGMDCILLGVLCAFLCLFWLRESSPLMTNQRRHRSQSQSRQHELQQQHLNNTNINSEENDTTTDGDDSEENNEMNTSTTTTSHGRDMNVITKITSCCLKPFNTSSKQIHPVGIYLFLIGTIFASITLATMTKTANDETNDYGLPLQFFGSPVAYWAIGDIQPNDYWIGFIQGALPQLPLTTLNSVISVCALAHSLYPEKRKRNRPSTANDAVISRKDVAISVGLMNLLFCPFGSMPNCHGAGGLAGQHRLGARHGASVVFLGMGKMLLAIFFGKSALTLLDAFPTSVLGVMLVIAGQELSTTGFTLLVKSVDAKVKENLYDDDDDSSNGNGNGNDDIEGEEDPYKLIEIAKLKSHLLRQNTVIAVITAIVIISTGMTHYGALSGWVAHMIYGGGISELISWYRSRRYYSATRINSDDLPQQCIQDP